MITWITHRGNAVDKELGLDWNSHTRMAWVTHARAGDCSLGNAIARGIAKQQTLLLTLLEIFQMLDKLQARVHCKECKSDGSRAFDAGKCRSQAEVE